MLDNDKKNQFIELRGKGMSFDKITKEIGVSKPTLIKLNKELADKIEARKAIELEELQEKYFLSIRKKIELCGGRLVSVKAELDKRIKEKGFSEFSTRDLLKFEEKYLRMGKHIL